VEDLAAAVVEAATVAVPAAVNVVASHVSGTGAKASYAKSGLEKTVSVNITGSRQPKQYQETLGHSPI
jgi:hypothetical protein